MNFLARLEKRSRLLWILIGFVLIAGVGVLDFLTGYEFAFSFFYLFPISLISWLTGRRPGIAAALASALVWLVTDVAAGNLYSQRFIYVWNTLIVFGSFVVVVLLLTALKKSLEYQRELAQTDYLTGALNSRSLFDLLQIEIYRSRRYKHPFSIAYIDIDDFKAVNDQLGHITGDHVLRVLVDEIRRHMRTTDVIARLGGDEFVLLLPETNQESAQVVLSRIQADILTAMQQFNWPVTLSIGALTCIEAAQTTDEIVRKVDDLMYSVKHGSKNGIKFSTYVG
jgi:diguanylate cyclase (GGDEF)-like protein